VRKSLFLALAFAFYYKFVVYFAHICLNIWYDLEKFFQRVKK